MRGSTRRALLTATAALPSARWLTGTAAAQRAPVIERLRLLVPAEPGGGWDGTAQVIGKVLREIGAVDDTQFEYRPGAGGAAALPRFVIGLRGQRDTLMVGGLTLVSSPMVNHSALTILDTTPLARLVGEALVLVVPTDSPIRTLVDFARALRADPLGVPVAGGSEGSADHLLLAMMGQALGIDIYSLSYRPFNGGGPAGAAILGGRARAGISNWSEFAPHVEAGRMRPIGISSDRRLHGIEVPTLREGGIDVMLYNWNAIFAPPGIGEEHGAQLEQIIETMAHSPAWEREAAQRHWQQLYLPRREFVSFLDTEMKSVSLSLVQLGLTQPRRVE